jgi:hypothetical protein
MNGRVTSYKELNPKIRMHLSLRLIEGGFLKGDGDPEINQVWIFIGDDRWVKFSRYRPCLYNTTFKSMQVDS